MSGLSITAWSRDRDQQLIANTPKVGSRSSLRKPEAPKRDDPDKEQCIKKRQTNSTLGKYSQSWSHAASSRIQRSSSRMEEDGDATGYRWTPCNFPKALRELCSLLRHPQHAQIRHDSSQHRGNPHDALPRGAEPIARIPPGQGGQRPVPGGAPSPPPQPVLPLPPGSSASPQAHVFAAKRRQYSLFPITLVHDSHVITTL